MELCKSFVQKHGQVENMKIRHHLFFI